MAMKKLQHASHECLLTSPEIVENGICNICYEDKPVEFSCITCNFDLCEACSKLPRKVSHEFHPEHPLEFCLRQHYQETEHILCSCCGCLSSESFYKCEECEIYLDLSCAILPNIFRSWDDNKKLHYSHAHLLQRCRPGPNARGSCLLCELPLSPSAICYGCVPCYSFVHERCLDVPLEIQHPVHPAHPLRRLDYTQNCGPGLWCKGCGNKIATVPIGCLECRFYLHLRCADSSLRGLMMHNKSHKHKLFYQATGAKTVFQYHSCDICKKKGVISLETYYHCLECNCKIHFECLEIPRCVIEKKFHIHPLVCKVFKAEDDSLEYCGVCETMVQVGHHAYSCKECDFLGHIECILRKEAPSPMYLKALYSCGKDVAKGTYQQLCATNKLESKHMVNDIGYIHVLSPRHMNNQECKICHDRIFGTPWKCEACEFQAHENCAKLAQPSRHRLHSEHDLTLLPSHPARFTMNCNTCKEKIRDFNLFCRICNLITCMRCVIRFNQFLGVLRRGQKVIGATKESCTKHGHRLFQVKVSMSYPIDCLICDEKLCGKVLSCMECGDIYHSRCIELEKQRLLNHPLHSHILIMKDRGGSNCIACKLNITKYGLFCCHCEVSFHIKCSKGVDASGKNNFHEHTLYKFWIDVSRVVQACSVCGKPCGASFYGCIDCNFGSHLECLGFPGKVKNQQHQHTVKGYASFWEKKCALCTSKLSNKAYSCKHCTDSFHMRCLMSMEDREAASVEEQLGDIYFIYIERFLLNMFIEEKEREEKEEKKKEEEKRARAEGRALAREYGYCSSSDEDDDGYYY